MLGNCIEILRNAKNSRKMLVNTQKMLENGRKMLRYTYEKIVQ